MVRTEITRQAVRPQQEKLYTYQDVAALFGVNVLTVGRWFKGVQGVIRPTKKTVRIPESVLKKFKAEFADKKRRTSLL